MASEVNHDALNRDVFQNRMIGVAEEMSAALRSAAYSSMIFDMYDYACAVLTSEGEIVAQAETIAAQLGILEVACRTIEKKSPFRSGSAATLSSVIILTRAVRTHLMLCYLRRSFTTIN
jgi:N-methylhydantoinase B/oxoprolinase/acetone carboxylase alpha subunit